MSVTSFHVSGNSELVIGSVAKILCTNAVIQVTPRNKYLIAVHDTNAAHYNPFYQYDNIFCRRENVPLSNSLTTPFAQSHRSATQHYPAPPCYPKSLLLSIHTQGTITTESYLLQQPRRSHTATYASYEHVLPEWSSYANQCGVGVNGECAWDIDAQIFYIKAEQTLTFGHTSSINADVVFLEAGHDIRVANVKSNIKPASLCQQDIMDLQDCFEHPFKLISDQNYGIVIRVLNPPSASHASTVTLNGAISSPSVLLCSAGDLITANSSSVVTSNKCCQSNGGSGAGGVGTNCGGAGHGGQGGEGYDPNTDQGAGGKIYDTELIPRQCGSGGGAQQTSRAGYGGGVINLNVMNVLQHDGTLEANGGSVGHADHIAQGFGSDFTSGGGSGGSVIMNISTMHGTGNVSITGGNAVDHGFSGGGGGGRLLVLWQGTEYGNFTGHLHVRGGKSGSSLPRGGDGQADAQECKLGFGGAFCRACAPGFFSPNRTARPCLACPAGMFSDSSTATDCALCEAGQFNDMKGQSGCAICAVGTYSDISGATYCDQCQHKPKNSFYSETKQKSVHCAYNCSATFAGEDCKKCSTPPDFMIGATNAVCNGAGQCYGDGGNPNISCLAHHNKCGTCNCNSGFVPPYCWTQIQNIVHQVGMAAFCAAVISSIFGFVFILWVFKCPCRKKKSVEEDYLLRGRSSSSSSFSLVSDKVQAYSTTGSATPAHSFGAQVCRIYLSGSNEPGSSLYLFDKAPRRLEPLLSDPTQYKLFAQHVNTMTKFTTNESVFYCLLLYTLPCFALQWLQKMRRRVVLRVFDRIQAYASAHTDLFHNPNIVLHPRWSPDYTLVYIDVVYVNNASSVEEEPVTVGFQSQQIYILAGTGSYMYPYFLDPNDPLVKAIATLSAVNTVNMSAPLIKFVCEFNIVLRVVDHAMLARTLTKACAFIKTYKEQFESTSLLGGLTVRLAIATPPDANVDQSGEFKITDLTGYDGSSKITIHPLVSVGV